ncbi:hypothetical protein [Mucilaginibacter phyllosphaerae]|uniref:Yip1 domain-containing protein n=1 Tax=Mucilaginibacter phyllosphaerae TaxID=1812349 RepID=A0A4Y8ADZ5_9SPHI|nr:hypothetical protein [Mucilaginibacter phyllosphaerae]MBB3971294.1 hypothetical protein [Mucilaginibacter phyllosphaerae]TEW66810.1 hypothetical protein E2R65_10365 [Mucilaginibacter phyllosphaerae]GGH12081.1 hypothetical protein GCM10007352_18660 [Mucilaginibacter phyllosphaerae]
MKIWKNYLLNLAVLGLLSCVLVFLTDKYILTSDFFTRNGQYLSGIPEQELRVYDMIQKWIYLSAVTYLLSRILIVTLILYTALYLSEVSVSFKNVFGTVILAEYIFLIPAVIKFSHFYLAGSAFTLQDWHLYYPLSTMQLVGSAPADWHYSLQTLNLFEVLYWFLLAAGIRRIAGLNYDESLKVVVKSYLPALLIWVSLFTFLTIIYFPATS